jgi:hypothetical protein
MLERPFWLRMTFPEGAQRGVYGLHRLEWETEPFSGEIRGSVRGDTQRYMQDMGRFKRRKTLHFEPLRALHQPLYIAIRTATAVACTFAHIYSIFAIPNSPGPIFGARVSQSIQHSRSFTVSNTIFTHYSHHVLFVYARTIHSSFTTIHTSFAPYSHTIRTPFARIRGTDASPFTLIRSRSRAFGFANVR